MPRFGGDADILDRLDEMLVQRSRSNRSFWKRAMRRACMRLILRLYRFDADAGVLVTRFPSLTPDFAVSLVHDVCDDR